MRAQKRPQEPSVPVAIEPFDHFTGQEASNFWRCKDRYKSKRPRVFIRPWPRIVNSSEDYFSEHTPAAGARRLGAVG